MAAYGINDAGRVVGIGTSPSGFNRAFRTAADGTNMTEIGTLGGDESWAYAINNAGQVAGTSSSLSIDTHAFLFTDETGMADLGTLGGYVSTAFALDSAGFVVGTAQDSASAMHAFVWSAPLGMHDLNELVPVNSGWVLTEARGVNDSGVIVGNGLLNGQPRAFLLTPHSNADTKPPVAIAKATDITSLKSGAHIFPVTFWDDVSVLNASVATGAVRVTGPNGYTQVATFYSKTPTSDGIKAVANFHVMPPVAGAGFWNGAANGVYTIAVEPNVVRDVAGNFMPGGVIGTFTVTTETKPVISIGPNAGVTMAVPATFALSALSSYPAAAADVFTFTIDWKNDGTEVQTATGPTGTMVTHTFSYKAIAIGNPRPVISLAAAPSGITLDATSGCIVWTPAATQTGSHRVTVRATSSAGVAEQTFAISVTPIPTDTIRPTAPASIALVSRSETSVTLTWPAGSDDVGVVSYKLYGLFRGSRSSHLGLIASGITNRSYISPSFATAYYVAAVDAAGNISLLSTPVSNGVLTLPVITHTNFAESATVIVGNSFLYTLSAAANPGPPTFSTYAGPDGLTVSRTGGADPLKDYAVVQWQPTATQVGVNTFTVYATNPNTTGGSATFTVTVLPHGTDTVKPTPVAQMTASAISFDHCTLSWTPAGDNIGVTNYHLVATHFGLPGLPNHVITLDVPGTNLTTPLTGLLPASGYNVSITPSDAAGNVGPSTSTLVFSTLTQPGVNFRIAPGTAHGTLSLDWETAGAQWLFTVEYTDSLASPNWQPVAPVTQWPSAITHFVVTPEPGVPSRFFRLRADPVGP
ncbi:MAG: putative Ig domain-containing protein [Verrucomicrobia bacterium]|nr:putative Ig domain-containing protein [Verrucomicrobiota bacterium]